MANLALCGQTGDLVVTLRNHCSTLLRGQPTALQVQDDAHRHLEQPSTITQGNCRCSTKLDVCPSELPVDGDRHTVKAH
jgi:hypothetical protein